MTETFYEVLGVAPDATTDEIEAAYRERLKEVHPDLNDDEDAGASTRRLIDARDVLVDETERERYDRLGHEAYVGSQDGTAGSDVARAAREAGYGGEAPSDRRERGESTVGDSSARARERREREHRASERVRQDRERGGTQESGATSDAATATGGHETATGTPGDRQTRSASPTGARGGNGSAWAPSGGYGGTQPSTWGPTLGDWVPTGRDLTLLGITFALYPVLLFSALVPAFPLFVNVVLGGCLLLVVGYLQSMPRVALFVFGPWSIVAPFVLLALDLPFASLVGIAVLLATWLPLGFTVLTISVLRL